MDATLRKYLENVIALEKTVYTQQRTINGLNHRIKQLAVPRTVSHGKTWSTTTSLGDVLQMTIAFGAPLGIILVILASILCHILDINHDHDWLAWFIFLSGPLIVFVCFLGGELEEQRKAEKHNAMVEQQYQENLSQEKQRLAQEEREKNRLVQQRDALLQAQSSTKEALQAYYAKNIIYPKYQNVIAVCSFYEYFMTGRCSTFTGHEGAYNLFEHEVLMNRILNQLDIVIQKLENIQQSQHELYRTLSEGQATAKQLYQETVRQSRLLEYNAQQTAIAAYNAQEARKEVEDLKWLKVAEMIYR